MFKNFFIVAFRNLNTHKFYSIINISGLSIGIASAILILLFVQDELSYDRFHENYSRIYRVGLHGTIQGNDKTVALTCSPMAETLVRDFPEVISATRLFTFSGEPLVRYEEDSYIENRFIFADSSFFGVFSTEMLQGDPSTALARTNTVVLTDEMASKYFGDEDPMGKVIMVGTDQTEYEVTGVVKKLQGSSHLKFDFLGSFASTGMFNNRYWISNNIYTYLLLQKDISPEQLESKFPDLVLKYVGPQMEQFIQASMEDFYKAGNKYGYFLQAIKDIHLYSDIEYEIEPGGNLTSIYIFSVIAIFLIFIASINFMNLATAQSASRAKEVGIRKVVGSVRSKLISQFLLESYLLCIIALVISIGLVELSLPHFNTLAGKELSLNIAQNKLLLPAILIIGIIVGLLSGSYPAFFLSAFQPVRVLKGKARSGLKGSLIRGILVVFQFTIAIILFTSTLIVSRQMSFIQKKDLGFNKDNLLVISRAYSLQDQKDAFKEILSKKPDIIQSCYSNNLPSYLFGNTAFRPEGSTAENTHALNFWYAGYDFQTTLKLKIKEGRWFSKEKPIDSTAVILNEAAVKVLGMENPVENNLLQIGAAEDGDLPLKIIGIVKDFHYESLHKTIHPLAILFIPTRHAAFLSARIRPEKTRETIKFIRTKWEEFVPGQPFEYTFLDDNLKANYHDDRQTSIIFMIFSVLSIFISSLGLLGLAAYTTEQRTKEIGVRKVMGANMGNIIRLLSKEVILLIFISTGIAWPVAYFFIKNWLQNFAVRISLDFASFITASLLALFIALLTISYQAYRSASSNPAHSLRYE